MEIYKYTPKKEAKNAVVLSGIFIFAAAVLMMISVFVQSYRALYQVSCIISATVAIQLTTRYILSNYVFVLDGFNFIIVRIYGKKPTQMCNINLQTVIGISDEKSFAEVEKEFGKIMIRRNFCQNMRAVEAYTYVFEFNEKKSAITFDADVYFIDEMKSRIEQAKRVASDGEGGFL